MYGFREAQPGDEPRVQHIVATVLREYGMMLDLADTDRDIVDIQASYVARGGAFRVLVDQAGQVVGCGGLYPLDKEELEVRKMYFLPAARGRGLGRTLLQSLVDTARARDAHRVSLETKSVLVEAIGLYRSFGFAEVDREHKTARCDRAFVLDLV